MGTTKPVLGTGQPGGAGMGQPGGAGTGQHGGEKPAVGTNGRRAGPKAAPAPPAPVVPPRVRIIPPGDPAEQSEHTLGGL